MSMYAEDTNEANTTGWLCNSKCISQNSGHAVCDPNCVVKSGEIVFIDNRDRILKIANQDKVTLHAGKKVKVKCRPVADTKETTYVDTVSLYGGGG
jgi:hypothetical protein